MARANRLLAGICRPWTDVLTWPTWLVNPVKLLAQAPGLSTEGLRGDPDPAVAVRVVKGYDVESA